MAKYIFVNGEVLDPNGMHSGAHDVLVENQHIKGFVKRGEGVAHTYKKIECKGLTVCPGLIDIHSHLREPGFEWKETIASGSRAAMLSGVTAICCMPNTSPVMDSPEVLGYVLEKARQANFARVYPIGSVSIAQKGEILSPLYELKRAGAIAISDDGYPVKNAGMMRRALELGRELSLPVFGHEEDLSISKGGAMNESPLALKLGLPGMHSVSEEICIARDIELSRVTGGHSHFCHTSTWRAVQLIERAKDDGISVTAEVTPHHLWLTEEAIKKYDTAAKMSPPLRQERDLEALKAGLKEGIIDCIATDHAPHDPDTKRCEFERASFGIIGFETFLHLSYKLVLDGVISAERWIDAVQRKPAQIIGKNEDFSFKEGGLADIIAFDPKKSRIFTKEYIYSKSKNTPFLGETFNAVIQHVLINGELKVKSGVEEPLVGETGI